MGGMRQSGLILFTNYSMLDLIAAIQSQASPANNTADVKIKGKVMRIHCHCDAVILLCALIRLCFLLFLPCSFLLSFLLSLLFLLLLLLLSLSLLFLLSSVLLFSVLFFLLLSVSLFFVFFEKRWAVMLGLLGIATFKFTDFSFHLKKKIKTMLLWIWLSSMSYVRINNHLNLHNNSSCYF